MRFCLTHFFFRAPFQPHSDCDLSSLVWPQWRIEKERKREGLGVILWRDGWGDAWLGKFSLSWDKNNWRCPENLFIVEIFWAAERKTLPQRSQPHFPHRWKQTSAKENNAKGHSLFWSTHLCFYLVLPNCSIYNPHLYNIQITFKKQTLHGEFSSTCLS